MGQALSNIKNAIPEEALEQHWSDFYKECVEEDDHEYISIQEMSSLFAYYLQKVVKVTLSDVKHPYYESNGLKFDPYIMISLKFISNKYKNEKSTVTPGWAYLHSPHGFIYHDSRLILGLKCKSPFRINRI